MSQTFYTEIPVSSTVRPSSSSSTVTLTPTTASILSSTLTQTASSTTPLSSNITTQQHYNPNPTHIHNYNNTSSSIYSILLIAISSIILLFFLFHIYSYPRSNFHPHLVNHTNITTQLFSTASNDCTTKQRSACYGSVLKPLFMAVRQCDSGLVATTCRCMSPDGAILESYALHDDGSCNCKFFTRRPGKTTWVMWLLCFNPAPRESRENRVQPAKLLTFGRLEEAYA